MREVWRENLPHLICCIELLNTEQGGRKTPLSDGAMRSGSYRPTFVIDDVEIHSADSPGRQNLETHFAMIFVGAPQRTPFNSPLAVTLVPMYSDPPYDAFRPGATFAIREGHTIVGVGIVSALSIGLGYDGDSPVRYLSGDVPRLGDTVNLDGYSGTVVGVVESGEFALGYESFSYLEGGLLIDDSQAGLVAILDDRKPLILMSRFQERT